MKPKISDINVLALGQCIEPEEAGEEPVIACDRRTILEFQIFGTGTLGSNLRFDLGRLRGLKPATAARVLRALAETLEQFDQSRKVA